MTIQQQGNGTNVTSHLYIDRCFSEGKRLCGVTKLYQNLPKSYVVPCVCQGVQGQVAVNVYTDLPLEWAQG